jgi:uncharacterized phage protein gp47/JayE
MPYSRPTLAELGEQLGARYRVRFPGADTNLRFSPDHALVALLAGSTDEDLAYLDWQVRQLFPFSADVEYLERWAAWKGVLRKVATPAEGRVVLTGTPGFTAPPGTQLQTRDGSVTVSLAALAELDEDGQAEVPATAAAGGVAGNIGDGVQLVFIGTPAGFADSGVVSYAFAGGAEAESDAKLRLRTALRYQQPSFGGSHDDWRNAALAVQGVTRVFVSPASPTPGAVTVWPLFDATRANGIPAGADAWFRPGAGPSAGIDGTGDQRLVLEALLAGGRPVCAHVYVSAVATQALDLTVDDLAEDTPAVRQAIALELANMLLAKVQQRVTPQLDAVATGYRIYRAWIDEAISRASGVRRFSLTLPAADVDVPPGTIAVLGVVTYG